MQMIGAECWCVWNYEVGGMEEGNHDLQPSLQVSPGIQTALSLYTFHEVLGLGLRLQLLQLRLSFEKAKAMAVVLLILQNANRLLLSR